MSTLLCVFKIPENPSKPIAVEIKTSKSAQQFSLLLMSKITARWENMMTPNDTKHIVHAGGSQQSVLFSICANLHDCVRHDLSYENSNSTASWLFV
jgi:hypothetical protein